MNNWISVIDRFPEDGCYVLAQIYLGSGDLWSAQMEVLNSNEHKSAWLGHPNKPKNKCNWYVTHWMPLPDPPPK